MRTTFGSWNGSTRRSGPAGTVRSLVGLRVNPQVGTGRIGMLSVSGRYSKFGVPLGERRTEIIDAYSRHRWLRALHLHIGSQGISQEQLTSAVRAAFELREEIHAALGESRIESVDIGGGLPWRYRDAGACPRRPPMPRRSGGGPRRSPRTSG